MTLAGQRILLIEDDPLIGFDIRCALEAAGSEVVGPLGRLHDALAAVAHDEFSLAVLDFEIIGGSSQRVAEALAHRGTPFLFHTASTQRVRELWPDRRIVTKPSLLDRLVHAAGEIGTRPAAFT